MQLYEFESMARTQADAIDEVWTFATCNWRYFINSIRKNIINFRSHAIPFRFHSIQIDKFCLL